MDINCAKNLKVGDVIWWRDPRWECDGREYQIDAVEIKNGLVQILDPSGDFLEVHPSEIDFLFHKD